MTTEGAQHFEDSIYCGVGVAIYATRLNSEIFPL